MGSFWYVKSEIKIQMVLTRNIILLLALVALIGCASIEPIPITGPSGNEGFTMRCSGMGRTLEDCFVKSGQMCANGYEIVNQDSSSIAVPSGDSIIMAPRITLTIECK